MMLRLLISFVMLAVVFLPGHTLAADRLTHAQCEVLADNKSVAIASSATKEQDKITQLENVDSLEFACKNSGIWPPDVTADVSSAIVEGEVEHVVTFGVTISNKSPIAVELTQIADNLPAPFKFESLNNSSTIKIGQIKQIPRKQSGQLLFALKTPITIAPFGTQRLAYDAKIPANTPPRTYHNAFVVDAAGRSIGPNWASVEVTKPPVSVVVSANPDEFYAGDKTEITYTVRITNNTTKTISLNEIRDTLPAPFKFKAIHGDSKWKDAAFVATPKAIRAPVFKFKKPQDLKPGKSEKFVYVAKVTGAAGANPYQNMIFVTADNKDVGPRAAIVTAIQKPQPKVTVTVDENIVEHGTDAFVIYTIEISNSSPDLVRLKSITDTLPTEFKYVKIEPASNIRQGDLTPGSEPAPNSDGDFKFTLDSPRPMLSNGAPIQLVYKVKIPQAVLVDDYDNIPIVKFDGGGLPDIRPTSPARVSVVPIPKPSIVVSASISELEENAGGDVTYTLTVTNQSSKSTVKVTEITDTLLADFKFKSIVAGGDIPIADVTAPGAPQTGPLTFGMIRAKAIPPNDKIVFEYVVEVADTTPVGIYRNKPTVVFEPKSISSVQSSNFVNLEVKPKPAAPIGKKAGGGPGPLVDVCDTFTVDKYADPVELDDGVGGTVKYTVEITNTCPKDDLKLTKIADDLPDPFQFDAIDGGGDLTADKFNGVPSSNTTGRLRLDLKAPYTIVAGDTIEFIYTATVPNFAPKGDYENNVLVTIGAVSEQADATVKIKDIGPIILPKCAPGDFSISPMTVRSDSIPEGAGGWITYTAIINSACGQEAKLKELVDTLPRPFRFRVVNDTESEIKSANLSSEPRGGAQDRLEFKLKPGSPKSTIPANGSVKFAYDAEVPANAPAGSYSNNLRAVIDGNFISSRAAAKVRIIAKGANPDIVKQTIVIFLAIFWGSLIWSPIAWFWVGISGYFILYEAGWKHTPSAAIFAIIMYGFSRFIGEVITFGPGGGISAKLEGAVKIMYAEVLSAGLGTAIAFLMVFAILVLVFYWISLLARIFTGNFGDETD